VTRVVVNRVLRGWRDLALVETGRGYIEISKPDRRREWVLSSMNTL